MLKSKQKQKTEMPQIREPKSKLQLKPKPILLKNIYPKFSRSKPTDEDKMKKNT